ncbi:Uncharacterised protein [Flavonifractor plautii]|uniref:Uncharacterized protein n=1 Tax=Flavonifractor plautii TaxID=292800 RepID=A0A174W3C2_FLAPL|nr:Uncharacterised protein [Flavonifractor plautii]
MKPCTSLGWATKVPLLLMRYRCSSRTRSEMAWRTVVRLMPNIWLSSISVGIMLPTG